MKSIHKINTWALAINVILFVIPVFGMLAMILLGVIQLVLAVGISSYYYSELDKNRKSLVHYYWLLVVADLSLIFITDSIGDQFFGLFPGLLLLFIFPGLIAFYFVYTTYSITKYINNQP